VQIFLILNSTEFFPDTMSLFSFIHAADLHLDSPFSSLSQDNPELANIMRSATFQAFDNIIQLCLDRHVDFLLVAGDVYDGADRSLRAQIRFREGLKKLSDAGIRSFAVSGNHDPLSGWSSTLEWPEGVYFFKDHLETVTVQREGRALAHIQGISYPERDERRNLSKLFRRKGSSFHIGLLHANVGNDTGHEPYAPCSLEDLKGSDMDYWALGHVHMRKILSKEFPAIMYPGNTQGRNIRETGAKGCYLVTVDEGGGIETEFIAADVVRWVSRDVSIEGIQTEQGLINALIDTCNHISETSSGLATIARISIAGNGPMYNALRSPDFMSDLLELVQESGYASSPFVWVEKINLEAGPEMDIGDLMKRKDFLGELLSYSNEISKSDNIADQLRDDLSFLFENPRARRFLDMPDENRLKRLLKEAEKICIQSLQYAEDE
jgi:DNA repair exonuclease SbcCD nuclease subunit